MISSAEALKVIFGLSSDYIAFLLLFELCYEWIFDLMFIIVGLFSGISFSVPRLSVLWMLLMSYSMIFMCDLMFRVLYFSYSIFEPAKRLQVKCEFLSPFLLVDLLCGEKGALKRSDEVWIYELRSLSSISLLTRSLISSNRCYNYVSSKSLSLILDLGCILASGMLFKVFFDPWLENWLDPLLESWLERLLV